MEVGEFVVPVSLSEFAALAERNDVNIRFRIETHTLSRIAIERRTSNSSFMTLHRFETHDEKDLFEYRDHGLDVGLYDYRLVLIDKDGLVAYSQTLQVSVAPPSGYHLSHNYPNPFNNETVLEYELPTGGDVRIEIFNIRGQKVYTVEREHVNPGYYRFQWRGHTNSGVVVASGTYLVRMRAQDFFAVRKLLFLK